MRDAVDHKPLWPLNWRDILNVMFAAISAFIAASAGLGGGGVLVPLFLLILGFKTHVAVALSNITIVAGALVNLFFNLGKRHPHSEKPLVDWDLILVMEPTTILGALAGGYLNKVTPTYMTTCGLALLLGYVSYKLVVRAIATWRKETRALHSLPAAAAVDPVQAPLLSGEEDGGEGQQNGVAPVEGDAVLPMSSRAVNRAAGQGLGIPAARVPQLPPLKIGTLVFLFLAVFAGDYGKQLMKCGTWQYWLMVLSIVPLALLVTLIARDVMLRQYRSRKASGYLWQEGDIEWTSRSSIIFPILCSSAGIVAGAFGIGGGIVKGPLLLELGVLPDVAAATCATMIFFTAAVASMVYLSFGGIPMDYAALFFVVGLVATMAGQLATTWLMRQLNRKSIIIIAMSVLMVLSLLMSCYEAGIQTYSAIIHHTLTAFHDICSPS
eukprot:jgi/Botrbrau1/7513/Bobra.0019s0004.1